MIGANLRFSLAVSFAALLIIGMGLNGIIITNVSVRAQTPPSISGTGSGTITFGISCPTSSPFHDPGGINSNANLNPDGTVNTGAFNVIDFNPLVTDFTKYSGQVTGGSVSESSFTLKVNYFECGQEQTGTITGQCGANQAITLESTGKAAFTGTGSVGCSIVTPPPPPSNHAPTANAGPDQTVESDNRVILDGTGSSDPDGDSLTYQWSQIAGPQVPLTDNTSPTPIFVAPSVTESTTLTFQLVVTDSQGAQSTPDTVNVDVTSFAVVLFVIIIVMYAKDQLHDKYKYKKSKSSVTHIKA